MALTKNKILAGAGPIYSFGMDLTPYGSEEERLQSEYLYIEQRVINMTLKQVLSCTQSFHLLMKTATR